MDRSLLEGNPHRVLEGMIIGAFAIGAREGYIYVRDEYPLAVKHVTSGHRRARETGPPGRKHPRHRFQLRHPYRQGSRGVRLRGGDRAHRLRRGARSANRGSVPPSPRSGALWGKPTAINNVETWANVPIIIARGAEWFSGIGTAGSKGTKIFSLVGKINNTGLVEVPMGITLREIIYDIGGGIPGGREFKAVQTGGPSGGCLPESQARSAHRLRGPGPGGVDHGIGRHDRHGREDLHGGCRQVFPELPPGRVLRQMRLLPRGDAADVGDRPRHHRGQGEPGDIELLEEMAQACKDASLCGLGQTAANPGPLHPEVFPRRVPGPHRGEALPGGRLQESHPLRGHPREMHGLSGLQEVPVPRTPSAASSRASTSSRSSKCIKCGACLEACRFEAVETQRDEAIVIVEEQA